VYLGHEAQALRAEDVTPLSVFLKSSFAARERMRYPRRFFQAEELRGAFVGLEFAF
jgi:hypothetical protein